MVKLCCIGLGARPVDMIRLLDALIFRALFINDECSACAVDMVGLLDAVFFCWDFNAWMCIFCERNHPQACVDVFTAFDG